MKTKDKIIFSIFIIAVIFLLIYLIRSVLTPFICSLIIAYFLDPLVDRLTSRYGLSRLTATSLIMGLFFTVFTGLCLILLPIIYTQSIALIDILPHYMQTIADDFYPQIANSLNKLGFKMQTDFSHLIEEQQIGTKFIKLSGEIFNNAISSSLTLINILSLIFITPILIFYLLKDWDILIKNINDFLPKTIATQAREIGCEINKTLSGYVRGQFNVCLILGIIYSSLLSITGLNFGFLIGLLTGLFSFIPYIGMLSGVLTAIIIALFQWGFDLSHVGLVSSVFIFGQIIESNFLTPKLIGSKIGLHPVWLIFGLFVFGVLFGFIGVLIAVPLTAICGVIIKHFVFRYKSRAC